MLQKSLHWSLLILAIGLWLMAAWGINNEEAGRRPEHIAKEIESDLSRRTEQTEGIDQHAKEIVDWIKGPSKEATNSWISDQPYLLFAYKGDSLVAWSSAKVLPPLGKKSSGRIYRLNNGVYYGYSMQRTWLPVGTSLFLLLPIAQQYPFNNEYLQPEFATSKAIDPHIPIADTPVANAVALHAPDGRAIAWVHPAPAGDLPEPPTSWIVWCWLLSLVAFATWLHQWASKVARDFGAGWGFVIVITAALSIRVALMVFHPPFRISESELFSPRLYASGTFLPSLGDLLLHLLAFMWMLLFVAPRLRYTTSERPAFLRGIIATALCSGLFGAGVLFIRITRSLVLDSQIPLDIPHLSSLEGSSLSGLLTASLLLSILLIVASIVRHALRVVLPSFAGQILILALTAGAFWAFFRNDLLLSIYAITALWLAVDVLGQYMGRLREGAGILRVGNIFWSMAHCLLLTLLLQHFSRIREGEARRHFAEHIATRHDDAMEYNFGQSLTLIRTDTALLSFFRHPTQAARTVLEERLASQYFNNALAAYQAQVYLYNLEEQPLFNRDTASLERLVQISEASIPSRTASDLFFREAATDDHIYLALMSIEDSAGRTLGAMAIDLEQKKIVSETVLPELLQPATINQAEKAAGYSYAIYAGGRLVAQTSNYPFPFYVGHDSTRTVYYERKGKDFSTLIYRPDAYRSVYVWRRFGTLSEALTLFSYLLLLRFLLLGLGTIYRHSNPWIEHPQDVFRLLRGIGLRRRLQLSIMGIVAFSFVAIGIATIVFLRQQYDNTSKAARQSMMQAVARGIQQWMKDRDSDDNRELWREGMTSADFHYFLSSLAATQKIDINLFDASGRLVTTTQQAIYDQGLLAPIMRHKVMQDFAVQTRSLITEVESIGTLRYQSVYAPLRAEGGEIVAYVNVPLFYAQRELDEQISSVVVTLINLYAAALLLSGLLAYFITRWVTRAFDLIIRQFGRLNLHRNELLQWPYDDEVGVLVAEYNKMVRKVEESVALLARNEREGAFREMARQVAHEIKNPLTPMSLYVQRLQRAIATNEPDAIDLARRVSEALLEQINNLSVIATEFGEFARIGTSRPEQIELSELLRNVVEPFAADATTVVICDAPTEPLYVMADRSQLVRIITNLMKNAIQAIPEGRQGNIKVCLERKGAEAVLNVTDNGMGISPEAQEKLFTPYFTTKSSGTGLGLAMTRQMVEAWGGSISYETVQGEGTTFIIRLNVSEG